MLRVGIIGAGFGTTGLLPAFTGLKGCSVVGVCTKRNEWKEFLKRDDIDAVAIAVPPHAQYEIAKVAIGRGLHVFAEKPLAANLKEAKELLALARKKHIVHGIDLMFPDIAAWLKVEELLRKKTYGPLRHISSRWEWLSGDVRDGRKTWRTDVKAGGGAIAFYFPHELYAIERFAGKITDIQSKLSYSSQSKNGGEVGADMMLSFENGVTGDAHLSCNTRDHIRHAFTFLCQKATIELANDNAIVDGFTITVTSGLGKKKVAVKKDAAVRGEDERAKIVRKLALRFVKACTSKGAMHPSFEDGVRAHELVDRIRRLAMR